MRRPLSVFFRMKAILPRLLYQALFTDGSGPNAIVFVRRQPSRSFYPEHNLKKSSRLNFRIPFYFSRSKREILPFLPCTNSEFSGNLLSLFSPSLSSPGIIVVDARSLIAFCSFSSSLAHQIFFLPSFWAEDPGFLCSFRRMFSPDLFRDPPH